MNKWLIISPHCDDMELGMGGYISKVRRGHEDVHITLGVVSIMGSPMRHSAGTTKEIHQKEQDNACTVLGIDEWRAFTNFKENGYLNAQRDLFITYIEDLIEEVQPTHLFIPLSSFNQDHAATFDACITALRPTTTKYMVPKVWAYEYPGNCWGDQPPQYGGSYISLEQGDIDKKTLALSKHVSQVGGRGNTLFGKAGVKALARMRGLEAGLELAEKFYLIRKIS